MFAALLEHRARYQAAGWLPSPPRGAVLMARLLGAASKDSEDAKAPFKAIRNAIDHFVFHG